MCANAQQDIDEVLVGIHAMAFAGHQQALDDADVYGTDFVPATISVFVSHVLSHGERSRRTVVPGNPEGDAMRSARRLQGCRR
jgi:hypothetical protein